MNRREYFEECSRLSSVFGEKLDAVDAHLAADPDLQQEGAYEKYWDLQNEAATAAMAWTDYCALHRESIR